jgi:hypothetical protein
LPMSEDGGEDILFLGQIRHPWVGKGSFWDG